MRLDGRQVVARVAADDPELAEVMRRCEPSAELEAKVRADQERENARRRAEELRALHELVRDALAGVFGKDIAQRARVVLDEGRAEVYLRRVERMVRLERLAARRKRRAA